MSHRLGEVCVHGSLARSCELCELTAELDAARTAHRAAVRALSQALGERDRLADGIREALNDPLGPYRILRTLLDVAGDDREDG